MSVNKHMYPGAVSVPIEVDPTSDDNDIIEVDSSKFSAGTYIKDNPVELDLSISRPFCGYKNHNYHCYYNYDTSAILSNVEEQQNRFHQSFYILTLCFSKEYCHGSGRNRFYCIFLQNKDFTDYVRFS